MNSVYASNQSNLIIIVLWGLVFAKCLTLEYLVQIYSIPINSFAYIWVLTLVMASVATVAFFRTKVAKISYPREISIIHLIWFSSGILALLSIGVLFLTTELNPYTIPTIISAILGIGYLCHGILIRKNTYVFSGIGWWIGTVILATRNNVESLSIFAFLVILVTILPVIVEIRQQRRTFF